MKTRRAILPILITLLVAAGALAACSTTDKQTLAMAPLKSMPPEVQIAPVTVRQAYQFAVANPEILQEIPCYCGCGPIGHASNYACYVSSVDAAGVVSFDDHSLGCSICVDITQDTMRLLGQGKDVTEIRAYIDNIYSKYGPSNMP